MKLFLIVPLLVLTLTSCATLNPATTLKYISFDDQTYVETNPDKIEIYNSRLELKAKFFEIGVLKTTGHPKIKDIKKNAASEGAMAIVKDGNNYIFIRFREDQNRDQNDIRKI